MKAINVLSASLAAAISTLIVLETSHAQSIPAAGTGATAEVATNACTTAVGECLAKGDSERGECLYEVSQSTPCAGQELGRLAHRRWAMAPQSGSDESQGLGLLGPQLVDKQCLSSFDTQLSSELILGIPSADSIQMLTSRLEGCREKAVDDVFRP